MHLLWVEAEPQGLNTRRPMLGAGGQRNLAVGRRQGILERREKGSPGGQSQQVTDSGEGISAWGGGVVELSLHRELGDPPSPSPG